MIYFQSLANSKDWILKTLSVIIFLKLEIFSKLEKLFQILIRILIGLNSRHQTSKPNMKNTITSGRKTRRNNLRSFLMKTNPKRRTEQQLKQEMMMNHRITHYYKVAEQGFPILIYLMIKSLI